MGNYRTCIFCNRNDSPLAKEDVLARWIAREFPGPSWHIRRFRHSVISNTGSNTQFTSHTGLGLISRKPCKRCNNSWMSNLEDSAKPVLLPLIRGANSILTPDNRLVIARWFIKTVILYEFLGGVERGPHRFFQAEERNALMESLSIPPNTYVFLAHYRGLKHVTTREMRLAFTMKEIDNDRAIPIDGYSATFTIKELALQTFSIRWPKDPAIGKVDVRMLNSPDDAVQIWPATGDVAWPPSVILTDSTIGPFVTRWANLIKP
jgi:hypothetical protein